MPFLRALPITGISISVVGDDRRESTICVSDETAGRIDELQFSLGEGPHWQSMRTGMPTLIDDVQTGDHSSWPIFGEAVMKLGVGALFAFPLTLGAATVGVADLYRGRSGALNPADHATALSLAASASGPAVERATLSAEGEGARPPGIAAELRREVQQATGMVIVQLNVTATEAFYRLKAHSFASGRSISEVSRDVVSRRLDFRDLPE